MSRKFYATVPSDGLRILAFVLLFVFCIGLLFALTIPSKGAIEPWLIVVTLAISSVGVILWSQVGCYVSSEEIEFRDMFRRRKTIAWRDLTAVESEADAVTLRASDQHIGSIGVEIGRNSPMRFAPSSPRDCFPPRRQDRWEWKCPANFG